VSSIAYGLPSPPLAPPPAPNKTTIPSKNSWRWLVCGLDGAAKTNLDKLAANQSIKYVLDEPWQFTCDLPSDNPEIYRTTTNDGYPLVSYGNRLIYGLRREEPPDGPPWVCRFSGVITILQDEAASDEPVTHLTADDAWGWAKSLPVLNPDGSLPGQNGVTYVDKTGDFIALDVIANAYAWMEATPGFKTPDGHWKWTAFGNGHANLFVDISSGTFETTDVIPKITFQQGASVADAWTQLVQTGSLDVVLEPIYRPRSQQGVLAVLNVYAEAGGDKPNAVFGWDMWPRNLVGVDALRDGTQIENWAQFYAGGLAAPKQSSSGSIDTYAPYWVQRNYSGPSDVAAVELLALAEVALRKKGKRTLQIDPTPERAPDPFTEYFLGDEVYVWAGRRLAPAGNALRGGVRSSSPPAPPSPNRVYGFEVSLADDQVETITNLLLTDPNASV
jgi:hypothetical protein